MNDLIDNISPRGKVAQNEEIYHMMRSSMCEYMNIIYNFRSFYTEIMCF